MKSTIKLSLLPAIFTLTSCNLLNTLTTIELKEGTYQNYSCFGAVGEFIKGKDYTYKCDFSKKADMVTAPFEFLLTCPNDFGDFEVESTVVTSGIEVKRNDEVVECDSNYQSINSAYVLNIKFDEVKSTDVYQVVFKTKNAGAFFVMAEPLLYIE